MCLHPHLNEGWGWCCETGLSPPVKYFTDRSKAVLLLWIVYVLLSCVCYAFVCQGGTSFVDLLCFYCLVFVMPLCASVLFVISWLSFMVSNCEYVTFPLVSWVRCGT